MFNLLQKPLCRTLGLFALLALGYWTFDLVVLKPDIEHRLPWAVAIEKVLLGIGQWIPNLHNHLPRIVDLIGVGGALTYARVLTATVMSVIVALVFYAATLSWRPREKLEWVPSRSIGLLERHRAISGIAAIAMAHALVLGFDPSSSIYGKNALFSVTGDPVHMLLSPICIGLILTMSVAYGVELTVYIRRYEKIHSDPDSEPKF